MILVIVYVGAVAVLFLFVVMMLDVDFVKMRAGVQRYAPLGGVVGGILFVELLLVLGAWQFSTDAQELRLSPMPTGTTNTEAIGRVLYTDYIYLFQLAGLILLVAMIGAIVLTLRPSVGTRKQSVEAQQARVGAVEKFDVPLGQGVRMDEILRRKLPPEPPAEPEKIEHGGHH
jgi:NADH-quinone oxidoreductase subunit J